MVLFNEILKNFFNRDVKKDLCMTLALYVTRNVQLLGKRAAPSITDFKRFHRLKLAKMFSRLVFYLLQFSILF